MEESERKEFRVPCWCPQCELPMKGRQADSAWYAWKVCANCFIEFIEGREQRWKDGWRPTAEQVKAFIQKISQD